VTFERRGLSGEIGTLPRLLCIAVKFGNREPQHEVRFCERFEEVLACRFGQTTCVLRFPAVDPDVDLQQNQLEPEIPDFASLV